MRWNDPRELVDVGIGLVGFFAFVFLIVTIVSELTGADALGWALTLLVLVIILGLLWRARIRMRDAARQARGPARTRAPDDGAVTHSGWHRRGRASDGRVDGDGVPRSARAAERLRQDPRRGAAGGRRTRLRRVVERVRASPAVARSRWASSSRR